MIERVKGWYTHTCKGEDCTGGWWDCCEVGWGAIRATLEAKCIKCKSPILTSYISINIWKTWAQVEHCRQNEASKPADMVPYPMSLVGLHLARAARNKFRSERGKLPCQPPAEHVSNTEQRANPLLDQSRARTTQGGQHETRNAATTRGIHLYFALSKIVC